VRREWFRLLVTVAGLVTIVYLFSLLACYRHTEVKDAVQVDTATETKQDAAKNTFDTMRWSGAEEIRRAPTETESVTETTAYAPDGGLARKVVRTVRRVVGESHDVKTVQAQDNARQRETSEGTVKQDVKQDEHLSKVETVKPGGCFSLGLGVVLGFLIVFGAWFAWRAKKWPW